VAARTIGYWLDLFTGKTWQEFQAAGSKVTGFRESNWKRAAHVKPCDIFLCYLTGVKRWVGILEVTGERHKDESPIFEDDIFPVRFPVKPLVILAPEQGVPMETFEGKLTFYQTGATSNQWTGHLRSSPTRYNEADGEAIASAIREAAAHPVNRPVYVKQLARSPNLYKLKTKAGNEEIEAVVSVPPVEGSGLTGRFTS
jgi:hypothetical protein